MIVTVIAMKGLIDPDLLNPQIINPATPDQSLTPSPIPAPQLIITPTIPNPPERLNSNSLSSNTFPLWLFGAILGGSAFVSLFVTAWLRFLSLPSQTRASITRNFNFIFTFIFKIIFFIVTLIPNLISGIFKFFIAFLKSLDQKSEESIDENPKQKRKKRPVKLQNTSFNAPKNNPVKNNNFDNPRQIPELNGFILSYNDEYNRETSRKLKPENNSILRKSEQKRKPQAKPPKPPSQSENKFSVPKKIRKKPISPSVKQTTSPYISDQNYGYDLPQVTLLAPEEKTPLDQKQPTLAELMDLRRRRSLSSLLNNDY